MYTKNGQAKKAADAIKKLHKADPTFLRDFNMLMEVHPFILELRQWGLGSTIFGDAFVYHYATFDAPSDPDNTMKIEHVVEYVNYLIKSGETESAIDVIHRGQRWLQGRKHEKAWDAVEDDSEYAPKRFGGDDGDESDEEANNINGGNELDVQLRHLLAIARLRLGQTDMAIVRTSKAFAHHSLTSI
jgi:general transcription factor 3C polypeptide 3 (transcription factor C subunit 4)